MGENSLKIGGIDIEKLVDMYGTPLYVYDEEKIIEKVRSLRGSISYPKTKIYYACKANGNPDILKLLKTEGIEGIDAVSMGEVELAIACGFLPEQISVTNPSISNEDLSYFQKKAIEVKVDSISQLKRWARISKEAWIRINPPSGFGHHKHVNTWGSESKFGIYKNELEEAKAIMQQVGGRIIGLHQHPGSDVLDINSFFDPLQFLYKTARGFPDLRGLNIGGGLGIPYRPEEKPLDLEVLGRRLSETFLAFSESYHRDLTLCLEPGRWFTAESGILLARINAIKQSPERRFVVVDTGFNHLIRPVLYGSYHKVVNASRLEGEKEKVWIAGNVCESGDLFNDHEQEREITRAEEGDLIAILDTGAYGYSMASNYTKARLPEEVMVYRGTQKRITQGKAEVFPYLLERGC